MRKSIVCILLSLLLVLAIPVAAEEQAVQSIAPQTRYLYIATAEQFLEFAENCRLDTYSQNLQVTLVRSIDLTGMDFQGIPTFSGTFLGRGHTISGLNITAKGSYIGLFRYLTDTAVVKDLHVEGSVTPGGSPAYTGGIAGSNEGLLEGCSFSGMLDAGDYVGGIVGINTVTGILENCTVQGAVTGHHFVGGLAGENLGVVRGAVNQARVNATAHDNAVDISDITIGSITGTEAANTTTDIGGIAGKNAGVIRDCKNHGDVGYQRMGYNIGGIAGSHSGYIIDCENYGQIHGRKEVGGIVGQMEPATRIEFSIDTLQVLEGQLDTLSGLTSAAGYNASSGAAGVTSQMNALENHMQTAKDALQTLLPKDDPESVLPDVPDLDTITAAQNALSESMKGMQSSANGITSGIQGTLSTLSKDMQAITGQIGAMGQTIKGAEENLGGSLTDISDLDTADDTTGKVTGCVNYGNVLADLNAGGITGAMAVENELDQEDNLAIQGESSLNFTGELRSVVIGCENRGTVTAKKQGAGGIVGWQALGLVKDCSNSGKLDAAAADYVGGIAGLSDGMIRACSAKSELSGSSYIGGIAGSGSTVTDCRSMTLFHTVTENMGEVLGSRTEALSQTEGNVSGNLYLSIGKDWGAIDGISYDGVAQSMERTEFVSMEGLSEMFKTVKVYFIFEDGHVHTVSLTPGGSLAEDQIPVLPEKTGYIGEWEGLAEADLSFIEFDTIFPAVYAKQIDTLQSDAVREDGKAILLAQGQFLQEEAIVLTDMLAEYDPALLEPSILEVWGVTVSEDAQIHTLRYCLPEGVAAEDVVLNVLDSETDSYRSCSFTVNGSYIVFDGENVAEFCIQKAPQDYTLWYLAAGGAVLLLAIIVTAVAVSRKKKKQVTTEVQEVP